MNLFNEFSGIHESALHQRLCAYRVTYVVRDGRLLWTATISRSEAREELARGVIVLLRDHESLQEITRVKVHEAIDEGDWALQSDLAPLETSRP